MDTSPTQSVLVGGAFSFPDFVFSVPPKTVGTEAVVLGGGAGNNVSLAGDAQGFDIAGGMAGSLG